MIKKILVANRGEIAIRIFRTCTVKDLKSVAIYTHVDRSAPHVRYADEAYLISDDLDDTSYLKPDRIIEIAKETGAAIHPGYGFLAENADFARKCEEEGVIFIGPSYEAIHKMGNKTEARKIMIEAGMPVVPGTKDILKDVIEAKKVALEVGYPIMLKASMGGGGKGMRLVKAESEIAAAFRMSTSEALNAFGDGSVYIEKYIENPHHIEIQVLADKHGNAIHLFDRECSVQRRHQKVIEETPSPFISEEVRKKMCKVSVEASKKIGYYSVGTFEFMVDKDQNFYFLEMNTRLQVEHAITEMITGIDLVSHMIKVANGEVLQYKQEEIIKKGHAIECRIYAEDSDNNFMPSPGKISVYSTPEGRNVRVDGGAFEGYDVPLFYDPMIAKVSSWGISRKDARNNMRRALDEYKILGIKTTIPFHLRVMKNKHFINGNYDTTFIETKFNIEDLKRKKSEDPTIALISAAVKQYLSEKEAASRAVTRPDIGESSWRHQGRMKNLGNSI